MNELFFNQSVVIIAEAKLAMGVVCLDQTVKFVVAVVGTQDFSAVQMTVFLTDASDTVSVVGDRP